jgi:pyridinium-3,5-biscarboxylic acid mononucleotide synthase
MTRGELASLLADVQSGAATPEAAQDRILQYLRQTPFEDLGFARLDHHRAIRQGCPEVVFGQGKTPNQIAAIAERIVGQGHSLLVTRTDRAAYDAVSQRLAEAKFHELARTITLGLGELTPGKGTIVVAAAGTADLPVAEEAAVSAEWMGNIVDRLYDVGVAGIHRLLAEQIRLSSARAVIVVAGMEGALPSVVGGLVDVPVIAVPTSVGYGASFGGLTALLAMLNSCAIGVSVVNIDNGFGAAAIASSINHLP